MYAVVKTSGRQYRVVPGDSFSVEKLEGTTGSSLDLTEVLMVGGEKTILGDPFVTGAKVTVVIEEQYRGPKILVFKKKRRQKYRKMKGHRSELTRLFVSEISSPAGSFRAETNPHVLDPNREKKVKPETKLSEVDAEGKEMSAAPKKKAISKSHGTAKKKTAPKKSSSGKAKSKK